MNLKMTIFWVVASCSLLELYLVSQVLVASIVRLHRSDDGGMDIHSVYRVCLMIIYVCINQRDSWSCLLFCVSNGE